MTPALNKPLPEFEALATGGVKFTPQAYLGQTVVLYFYPKDNTPGCTTEAMQFRDHHKDFVKAGAVVFGVSRDNMASHDKFRQNLELPFNLIADTEEKLCHMFGVVKNKIMYGKKVKGIERSTFLIDPSGVLRAEHFEQLVQLGPELVIFGSGRRLRFAAAPLLRSLIDRRIGVETMDTAAACRTYNVLASEGRAVLAALLIEAPGFT